jgi:hypothetical protein
MRRLFDGLTQNRLRLFSSALFRSEECPISATDLMAMLLSTRQWLPNRMHVGKDCHEAVLALAALYTYAQEPL